MSQSRTRQLARALRLSRSTSFSSYASPNPSGLTFGQHFAQTANYRPISPSSPSNSTTSSTYSSTKSSKDYGYSSAAQNNSYQSTLKQPYSSYLDVKPSANSISPSNKTKTLQRHSSFNPSDYRDSSLKSYPQIDSYNSSSKIDSYSIPSKNDDLSAPIRKLPSNIASSYNRRAIFTKCRRSSSLMSRYKPKALRFADDTPCILSICVTEPQKSPKIVYTKEEDILPKTKGILKTANNDESSLDFYSDYDEFEDSESVSDDNFKPPVIPRSQPPNSTSKGESFQNGSTTNANLKDATFGSTADSHYKALYEKTLVENERLRNQIDDYKVQGKSKEPPIEPFLTNGAHITVRKNFNNGSNSNSSSSSPAATPSTGNSAHLDDSDRRAYERKISELEYELQKAKQLQSDHKRLKDENNALIRVISKLSKDYPRQTTNISSSTPLSASSTGAQTKSTVSGVSLKHSTHN